MSGQNVTLRPMLPADGPVLAAIFQAAVEDGAAEDYDEEQRAAWAAEADDEIAFAAALASELTLVAVIAGAPVGFVSLKDNERISRLYVYPGAGRRGAATALLDAAERLAKARGAAALEVEASDTARDLFTRRGYEALHRQTTMLGDVWIGNTAMRKAL